MRFTRITLVCLMLCTMLAGIGCAGLAADAPLDIAVTPQRALEPTSGGRDEAAALAARGANDFAFRLSAELAGKIGEDNFVCSPYSVWLPLAALYNATDTRQAPALLAALNVEGISGNDLDRAASRMLYDLTNRKSAFFVQDDGEESGYDPLKIANAIFVDHSVTLRQDFAQTYMDYYRGAAMRVDFASPEAVEAVNRWASENTEGLIPEIVQKFGPNVIAAMANAIYFADRWNWEFSPEETREGVFHAPNGEREAFFMLREGSRLPYYEDDVMQAMPLSFMTGGGMLILMPKDGDAVGLLASMTDDSFRRVVGSCDDRPGKLLLPRFSIATDTMELSRTLQALGVPLFDERAAPLSGLVEEDLDIWLSGALHKAVIQVDERGTTAAAVTVVMMEAGSAPRPEEPGEPFEMICDRPFAFVLYGRTFDGGNQVLFTGVVNQP